MLYPPDSSPKNLFQELNVTTDVIVAETEENQFEAVALAQEKGQRNDTPLVPPKKRQRTLESCLNSPEISTGNGDTMPIGPVSLAKIGESSVYSSGAQAVLTGTSITTEESGEVKTSASALPPALKFLTGSQPNFKVNPVTDKDESNKCEICGKQFNKPGMLKLHMDIHSYQQSGRKYEYRCTFCSAVFRSRAALQSHVVCHSKETSKTGEIGEVPVETVAVGCVRRQEASVDKNGPSAQRPNGLKARPFACVDCGCAFRIHGHLAKHLRCRINCYSTTSRFFSHFRQ